MANHRTFEIDTAQKKLGPIWLSPGILPRHVLALFYSGAMAVGFVNLLNLIQPLLLDVQLGMSDGEGSFTAYMYIALEITTVLAAAPLANMSDLVGRRPIFVAGFIIVGSGLFILPTVESQLLFGATRVFISVGIACCTTMIASLMADYPQNASRGKFIGFNGICTAIGVTLVSMVLVPMAARFEGWGYAPLQSAIYTVWIGAGLALFAAVVCYFGIKKGRATEHAEKLSFFENAKIGIGEIRRSPRLILGCASTAMSRGDLTVLASFFSLWVVKVGTDGGIDAADAAARSGMLFGLMQVSMLLFMPVMAIFADRLDRVSTLCVGITFAMVGYLSLAFAVNPFESNLIYITVVLAGFGEAAMIITVPALIGQEAPAASRGSIIGVAATFGALGIIAMNSASGQLFDKVDYQAPFMFMALLNLLMLVWAVIVRLKYGTTADANRAEAAATP